MKNLNGLSIFNQTFLLHISFHFYFMSQYIKQQDLNIMFTQFQQDMYRSINSCVELKTSPLTVLIRTMKKSIDSTKQQISERLEQLEHDVEALNDFKHDQIEKILNHEIQLEKHSKMFKDVPEERRITLKILVYIIIGSFIVSFFSLSFKRF